MKNRLLSVVFLSLVSAAFADDLPSGIMELTSLETSAPESELSSFDSAVSSAKLVAIGESAHGSAGYVAAQKRLSFRLIQKYGFKNILIEQGDTQELNRYLQTCQGDLTAILHQLDWRWKTQEFADFMRSLCEWNLANPDAKVSIEGIDAQKPWADSKMIRQFYNVIDPDRLGGIYKPLQENCFGANYDTFTDWAFSSDASAYFQSKALPEDKHQACVAAIQNLQLDLLVNKMIYVQTVSADAWVEARMALKSLEAWQLKSYYFFKDSTKALEFREKAMSQLTLWKYSRALNAGKNSILLAHNLHIGKDGLQFCEADHEFAGVQGLGLRLADALKSRYVSVGLTGYEVHATFNQHYPIPTSEDSLDLKLHAFGKSFLMIDLKSAWFQERLQERELWKLQEEHMKNGRTQRVGKQYDLLLYLDRSAAALPL